MKNRASQNLRNGNRALLNANPAHAPKHTTAAALSPVTQSELMK